MMVGINLAVANAGCAFGHDLVFPDTLAPLDSLVAEAGVLRPMVQAGEAEVRAADATARGARREIWPDLQVGVQYGQRPMAGGVRPIGRPFRSGSSAIR